MLPLPLIIIPAAYVAMKLFGQDKPALDMAAHAPPPHPSPAFVTPPTVVTYPPTHPVQPHPAQPSPFLTHPVQPHPASGGVLGTAGAIASAVPASAWGALGTAAGQGLGAVFGNWGDSETETPVDQVDTSAAETVAVNDAPADTGTDWGGGGGDDTSFA